MKQYAVQYQANGHWTTVVIYKTKAEASSYAQHAIPEYVTRIVPCMH